MRSTVSYLRLIAFIVIAYLFIEFAGSEGDVSVFEQHPWLWAILAVIILFAIGAEISIEALRSVLYRTPTDDAKKRYDKQLATEKQQQFKWIKDLYKKLTASKPIEEEGEIILDHNYDGIRELDNKLPPWWVYSFYATIVFAIIYMARYHIFGGVDQEGEYEIAVAQANIQIEEWKKTAKDLVDVNTVELLTDAGDLSSGKSIFEANCAACHKVDGGGGIGPNLTDDYWIMGGGIKNVFNTISEGGRSGKGMISWKTSLKPSEMAQVASYVLSLHGTTPLEPKEPEGELWIDENARVDEVDVDIIDSTKIRVIMEDDPVGLDFENDTQ